jgi:hypothetical protein
MVSRNTLFQDAYSALGSAPSLASYKVTAAYHDDGAASFPQIVVRPVEVPSNSEGYYASQFSRSVVNLVLEIHALDSKTMDAITDLVIPLVKSVSWSESQYFLGLEDSYSFNEISIGRDSTKRNIHTRILVFSYSYHGS